MLNLMSQYGYYVSNWRKARRPVGYRRVAMKECGSRRGCRRRPGSSPGRRLRQVRVRVNDLMKREKQTRPRDTAWHRRRRMVSQDIEAIALGEFARDGYV